VILGAAGPGCTGRPGTLYPCDHPIIGRMDPNGALDSCCEHIPCPGHCLDEPCPDGSTPDSGLDATIAEGGGAGGGPTCSGVCVLLPPDGWSEPQLFWSGPVGTAPQCPADAPVVAYQGHADPVIPPPAACTCARGRRSARGRAALVADLRDAPGRRSSHGD